MFSRDINQASPICYARWGAAPTSSSTQNCSAVILSPLYMSNGNFFFFFKGDLSGPSISEVRVEWNGI